MLPRSLGVVLAPLLVLLPVVRGVGAQPAEPLQPRRVEGIAVREVGGRPAVLAEMLGLTFVVSITVEGRFLLVDALLHNRGERTLPLGVGTMQILGSDGVPVYPLQPDRYIEIRYGDEPLELDADGNPVKETRTGFRFTGPEDAGRPIEEVFLDQQIRDDDHVNRLAAARELRKLEQGRVHDGGVLRPGERSRERIAYQNDHVERPLRLVLRVGTETVEIPFGPGKP